jgi:GNAT superfamily N-acetyltransferase
MTLPAAAAAPYQMRVPQPGDREALARLFTSRGGWLAARGWSAERVHPAVAAEPEVLGGLHGKWLLWEDEDLVGYIDLWPLTLGAGWTPQERAERAVTVFNLYTHPAHRADKPSRIMLWWALDYAYQHDVACVRMLADHDRLAEYFVNEHGWERRRTISWPRRRHLLTRRTEAMPGLKVLVSTAARQHESVPCSGT